MEIIEVLPRLHMLRFPIGQAYLWRDGDELTLIDTGTAGEGAAIAEAVRTVGLGPNAIRRIVLTHFHPDHVGSAQEVASWGSAEVLAHRADAPVIRGDVPGPPPVLLDWELPLYERTRSVPPAPPTRVDRELAGGEVLEFGGGAHVVAAPGHTDGSIALHLPEHGVLFTGDCVANVERLMLGVFNVDRARALETFRRLAALDARTACFGHGDPLVGDAGPRLRASADRHSRLEVEDGGPLAGA